MGVRDLDREFWLLRRVVLQRIEGDRKEIDHAFEVLEDVRQSCPRPLLERLNAAYLALRHDLRCHRPELLPRMDALLDRVGV